MCRQMRLFLKHLFQIGPFEINLFHVNLFQIDKIFQTSPKYLFIECPICIKCPHLHLNWTACATLL